MTAPALIATLARRGVRLSVGRAHKLRVEAQPGIITPADLEELRRAKGAVLALLGGPSVPQNEGSADPPVRPDLAEARWGPAIGDPVPGQPAWISDPSLTVSLAQVRDSIAFAHATREAGR